MAYVPFFILFKTPDDAQPLLGQLLPTQVSLRILFRFSITCTSITGGAMMNGRQLWWRKHHYQGCQKRKTC